MSSNPIRLMLALLLGAAMLGGCAATRQKLAQWHVPGMSGSEAAAPLASARQLAAQKPQEAVAILERAVADQRAPLDALLYELGIQLISPPLAHREAGKKVLQRLLDEFPESPHRRAAQTVLMLLGQVAALEAQLVTVGKQNVALQQDLQKILDIDMEAERLRQDTDTAP